jgi:hypothetical protein
MKFGAEPKKTAVLAGLVLVGGYFFYENVIATPGGSEPSRAVRPAGTGSPTSASALLQEQAAAHKTIVPATSSEEWLPSLKEKRPEDRVDPMTIDPTLRRDLLAKVQSVESPTASRNLFKMKQMEAAKAAEEAAKLPPPPPPPPPILLKYYGYSTAHGESAKHAFFLDGDDILVAAEGEMLKKRYRVVRIGVSSVVMEDTQFKHEQTLQLAAEEAKG